MSHRSEEPAPEAEAPATRRSRRVPTPRLDLTTGLAVALPLALAAAIALVRTDPGAVPERPPELTTLTQASVVCPAPITGGAVQVTTAGETGAAGVVALRAPSGDTEARVSHGEVTTAPADGPVVIAGADALAPGLVAGRSAPGPLAALDCPTTVPDQWFTGLGAGPTHSSVVELVNPNPGPAIADIVVIGEEGPMDVPALRGIAVPGGSTQELDLAAIVPYAGYLALHATVVRGQLAMTVRDRGERLTGGIRGEDWIPGQAQATTSTLLLGIPPADRRTLVVANGTDDQARAEVRVVTAESVFTPNEAPALDLAPQSVGVTDLGALLDSAPDAVGILIESNRPVSAMLRSAAGRDVTATTAGAEVTESTTVLVPAGEKRVVLGGATAVGAAAVVARGAAGDVLLEQRVELAPGRATTLDLPADALLVQVTPERTPVRGAVVVTADGTAVVPLRELVRTGARPDVAPGLP